ncbi:MAG: DegT/DnrJ/EryC1/StrS family aminotransferase, partial [Dongiaceae bacterium]
QLEKLADITRRRLELWRRYHELLVPAEAAGRLRRPMVPAECGHNGHIYHVLLRDAGARDRALEQLRQADIQATFHYVPLHNSPAGRRLGRPHGTLSITEDLAGRLLRLPLFPDLATADQDRVVRALLAAIG